MSAEDDFARQLREALTRPVPDAAPSMLLHGGIPPVSTRARPAVSPRRATPRGASTGPATREPGQHPCPGCAKPVLDHLLACRGCWGRLPRTLREGTVRAVSRDPLAATSALVQALSWWRTHPAG